MLSITFHATEKNDILIFFLEKLQNKKVRDISESIHCVIRRTFEVSKVSVNESFGNVYCSTGKPHFYELLSSIKFIIKSIWEHGATPLSKQVFQPCITRFIRERIQPTPSMCVLTYKNTNNSNAWNYLWQQASSSLSILPNRFI